MGKKDGDVKETASGSSNRFTVSFALVFNTFACTTWKEFAACQHLKFNEAFFLTYPRSKFICSISPTLGGCIPPNTSFIAHNCWEQVINITLEEEEINNENG